MTLSSDTEKHESDLPSPSWRFFGSLGPGLITGAADDDPSGISTYSVAGASFGYRSCAYAIAEAAAWRHGSLAARPGRARKFYAVMAASMALGWALTYVGFNAIRLLFVTAIINGLLAPPLVLIIVLLTSDRRVMGDAVNPRVLNWLGCAAFATMIVAACGLLLGQ